VRIDEIPINPKVISLLEQMGISELFPPQEDALKTDALNGKNLVLAIPTSSGKTLVAEICMLKAILDGKGKALYLVPLRSLAREKYIEFKKYESLGITTSMSIGDYDSPGTRLKDADIIVLTTERADSIARHKAEWLQEIGVIIIDEIHLVNDSNRGPTLEMVVAKMMQIISKVQIIALSATISNSEDIAGWLDADLVKSDWRPVPLNEGVYLDGDLDFSDGSSRHIRRKHETPLADLICDILDEEGQVLIFVSTRRYTMSVARKIARSVRPYISPESLEVLSKAAKRIAGRESVPDASKVLARLMIAGTAFHHAGLNNQERTIVEDCFRNDLLKVIVATPTLAAGVNLPARRVIIRDYRRFERGRGSYFIPVLEYKQMAGRAGRPKFDKYGESVLLARSPHDQEFLMDRYVLSEPESITSKLASVIAIRSHLLASISAEMTSNRGEIDELIDGTFFSYQFSPQEITHYIESALAFLEEADLIKQNQSGFLSATSLGRRASQLYIDPYTAILFRDVLSKAESLTILGILHLICYTPDQPSTYITQSELEDYEYFLEDHLDDFLVEPPDSYEDPELYLDFLGQVKTARLLNDWISERTEREITDQYNVGMGDVYRYTTSADWLLYSASEVARVIGTTEHIPTLYQIRSRMKYGVRPELIELIKLRGIGRIRSRMLYNHDMKTLGDLYSTPLEKIARIPTIGTTIAESIKKQLGVEVESSRKKESITEEENFLGPVQTLLEDFEPESD
jgi:helicase